MKYRNKKITYDGITFDSRLEMNRYCELKLLERAKKITGLELQKEYILIPPQYEKSAEGKKTRGRCIERAVKYIADFAYTDEYGQTIVEDTKGVKTKDYIIKRKLMLYVHGIRIREIS